MKNKILIYATTVIFYLAVLILAIFFDRKYTTTKTYKKLLSIFKNFIIIFLIANTLAIHLNIPWWIAIMIISFYPVYRWFVKKLLKLFFE